MGTRTYLSAVSNCSNTTLVRQAAQGDQSAWTQLVDRYDGVVRSVAGSFRLQAADISDIAQTTWLRLVQNLHTIRRSGAARRMAGGHRNTGIFVTLAPGVQPRPRVDGRENAGS
jgi:hypothetical protein